MTRRQWALAYTLAAAGMAALGALTAGAIVALEERSSRRLGDADEMPTGDDFINAYYRPALVSGDTLASTVRCPDRCTCHGRYGERP